MTVEMTFEAAVRTELELSSAGSSKFSADLINTNIRAAGSLLEKAANRFFRDRTATIKFTSEGRAQLAIPGLRAATSVTLAGAALTEDSTYWMISDLQQSGVSIAIQLRGFIRRGYGPQYFAVPDWFDRGLDLPDYRDRVLGGSLPNDLVIAGSWGYTDTGMPEDARKIATWLAAYLTLRPAALLSGAFSTPEGNVYNLSNWPAEVQAFVQQWHVGDQAVSV